MKTIKQRHDEYITRVKAAGHKTLPFTPPCCGKEIEERAANPGETWDSLATCPHCEALFWKIATHDKITGTFVQENVPHNNTRH